MWVGHLFTSTLPIISSFNSCQCKRRMFKNGSTNELTDISHIGMHWTPPKLSSSITRLRLKEQQESYLRKNSGAVTALCITNCIQQFRLWNYFSQTTLFPSEAIRARNCDCGGATSLCLTAATTIKNNAFRTK